MPETLILLFTSIPLLALFIMGIYSCVLAIMVEEELDARKEHIATNQVLELGSIQPDIHQHSTAGVSLKDQ